MRNCRRTRGPDRDHSGRQTAESAEGNDTSALVAAIGSRDEAMLANDEAVSLAAVQNSWPAGREIGWISSRTRVICVQGGADGRRDGGRRGELRSSRGG